MIKLLYLLLKRLIDHVLTPVSHLIHTKLSSCLSPIVIVICYFLKHLKGLMRDMFTHKITTPEHWYLLMRPEANHKDLMTYDLIVGNDTIVTPSYDPHCIDDISGGCEPVEIISAERLVETDTGPAEGRKIAKLLESSIGVKDYLIPEDAYECIWTELIINKKGLKTFIDREGLTERSYYFSEEMIESMVNQLNRLITKYSGPDWNFKTTANYLVELLQEHKALIEAELAELQAGRRQLREDDFLGPKTREAMFGKKSKAKVTVVDESKKKAEWY